MTITAAGETVHTRHASWAELFFDLVAVAGVAALARVLGSGVDARSLGLYALLFLTFWLSWTTFMLYSNVAADRTHVVRLLTGMFGLGVMAASVPGVAHAVLHRGEGARSVTVFTVAYIATRVYGSTSWRRGEVLLDFPVAQYSTGLMPWLVSIWVHASWKPVLWAFGTGLDLLLVLVVSGSGMLARLQDRVTARAEVRRRGRQGDGGSGSWRGRRGGDGGGLVIRGVSVDPAHLSERLGLFVIVVLGESVVQIVDAAGRAPGGIRLVAAGLASFVLLAGLFGLSVTFGYAGLPHLRAGHVPVRAALGLHCLVTGVLATVAVSLSAVVTDGAEPLSDGDRWLLCGAVAAYFLLGVGTGVISGGSDWQRTTSRITTGIVAPLLIGSFGSRTTGLVVVACLGLVVLAHLWFERRSVPTTDRAPAVAVEPRTT